MKSRAIRVLLISLVFALSCVFAQTNQTVSNETEETESASKGLQEYSQKQSPYEFPNETGFEHPIGSKKITKGSSLEVGELTEEGLSWLIESSASLEITLKTKKYVVEIISIEEETMSFEIKNILNEQTILKGEKNKFDLDADGMYDLSVTYHKQFPPGGRFADISLYLSNEQVTTSAENEVIIPEETLEEVKKEISISSVIIISSVLLVAIGIFLYIILKD